MKHTFAWGANMRIIEKIVTGGNGRKTRFHTENGHLISLREFRNLPVVVFHYLTNLLIGRRPLLPWWPMPVIPFIEKYLSKRGCSVIEFGSGSSTIWLAKRAKIVHSIEDNEDWSKITQARLNKNKITNATVHFLQDAEYYNMKWADGIKFDLAIVDGSYRWKCIEAILPFMKKNSIIYLDNSDCDKDKQFYPSISMSREAQKIIERTQAHNGNYRIITLNGLISGEIHAGEGMLLINDSK